MGGGDCTKDRDGSSFYEMGPKHNILTTYDDKIAMTMRGHGEAEML